MENKQEPPKFMSETRQWVDVDTDEQDYIMMMLGNASYHYFDVDPENKSKNNEETT